MSRPVPFSLARAFICAGRGVWLLAKGRNGRIQIVIAIIAVAIGLMFRLSAVEWIAVCLAISLVLSMEAMNTGLEHVVDIVSPGWNAQARDAKDLAAGGVLIASIGAVIVGLIVYLPHVIALVTSTARR